MEIRHAKHRIAKQRRAHADDRGQVGDRGASGRAGNQQQALAVIDDTAPDIALIDIRLTRGQDDDGLLLAEHVRARYPEIGILVLSSYLEPAYAERLLSVDEPPRAIPPPGR